MIKFEGTKFNKYRISLDFERYQVFSLCSNGTFSSSGRIIVVWYKPLPKVYVTGPKPIVWPISLIHEYDVVDTHINQNNMPIASPGVMLRSAFDTQGHDCSSRIFVRLPVAMFPHSFASHFFHEIVGTT